MESHAKIVHFFNLLAFFLVKGYLEIKCCSPLEWKTKVTFRFYRKKNLKYKCNIKSTNPQRAAQIFQLPHSSKSKKANQETNFSKSSYLIGSS